MSRGLIEELQEILSDIDIPARITGTVPTNVGHDFLYRSVLITASLVILGKQDGPQYSLNKGLLGIAQFIGSRPSLAHKFGKWVTQSKTPEYQLYLWPDLPRGYLTDSIFTDTLQSLLFAKLISIKKDDHIVVNMSDSNVLTRLYAEVAKECLFGEELTALHYFKSLKPTMKLFGIRH